MASQIHTQLSHCGVYARDIDTMVAFYTKTIGLVVSDAASAAAAANARS